MERIETDTAPRPAGHYSQGIAHGGVLYVAGQLPLDPRTGEVVGGDIEEQTERALRNVEAILQAGGSGLGQLLSATLYITDRTLWAGCNAAFARVLGQHRPARAIVPVPELRHGCLVEIQATAALPPR